MQFRSRLSYPARQGVTEDGRDIAYRKMLSWHPLGKRQIISEDRHPFDADPL
jgi:hypothetical protein